MTAQTDAFLVQAVKHMRQPQTAVDVIEMAKWGNPHLVEALRGRTGRALGEQAAAALVEAIQQDTESTTALEPLRRTIHEALVFARL